MTLSTTSPPASTTDATDEETSTESSRASTSTPSPRSLFFSPSSSFPPSTKPSVSDSGVTHTIPNESTVTVTRHTTITRQLPSTTTDSPAPPPTTEEAQGSTSTFLSQTPPATNTSVPNGNTSQTPAGGINTGAVIGIAVGGVFAAAGLLVFLLWLWRRRRGRAATEGTADGDEPALVDKSRLHDSIFGRRPTSASLPRHPTPRQASERGGYGYDPFAPFGGRADQPVRTLPAPEPNTFEMDGRGIHVAELPGTAMTTANGRLAVDAERRGTRSAGAVEQRPSSDPRATLNYLPRVDGRPAYINQWSQYKMLAGDARTR
ncbi:hypothetical protein IF1G_05632 [Cordyceps javanica]|uniref:Uncharacterized protein n=1 Tax=Cordyceps javanica TaxID=43265 RepID=A0A545V276_9HYPO|nr:hypothetical protein IF1G_05632 [Cordyceps javanica]TQW06992.1 hypothetical protein IF2G_05376 [Cordyceps javanica]